MRKYRLSEEEICKFHSINYQDGIRDAEDRLIPLLVEKDALLRECKKYVQESYVKYSAETDRKRELLKKLKDI